MTEWMPNQFVLLFSWIRDKTQVPMLTFKILISPHQLKSLESNHSEEPIIFNAKVLNDKKKLEYIECFFFLELVSCDWPLQPYFNFILVVLWWEMKFSASIFSEKNNLQCQG